jgi:hypothetical protein
MQSRVVRRSPAHGQGDLMDKRLGSGGSPGIPPADDPGEQFGRGSFWTLGFPTPEPSRCHPDHHAAAVDRKVVAGRSWKVRW